MIPDHMSGMLINASNYHRHQEFIRLMKVDPHHFSTISKLYNEDGWK